MTSGARRDVRSAEAAPGDATSPKPTSASLDESRPRSGASLLTVGHRARGYAGGVVVIVAIVGAVVLASGWFERRAEQDLVRKLRK